MRKINTFLIGAQKAGTTSLYDWMGQHPEIHAPDAIKDYHYFTNESYFKKGIKHLEYFYRSKKKILLHGAVNYLFFDELASSRIQEYNEDIKIIICLREPVNRAISAYNYFKRTLREDKEFSEAIDAEINQDINAFEEKANNTYIEHGLYSKQIQTFINKFGIENCHFVFFEELIDSRKQEVVMQDVCRYLEIDDGFKFNFIHLNASAIPKSQLYNFIVRKSGLTKWLKMIVPLSARKRLGKRIEQKNIGSKKIETQVDDKTLENLSHIFKKDIDKLEEITGRDIKQLWLNRSTNIN